MADAIGVDGAGRVVDDDLRKSDLAKPRQAGIPVCAEY